MRFTTMLALVVGLSMAGPWSGPSAAAGTAAAAPTSTAAIHAAAPVLPAAVRQAPARRRSRPQVLLTLDRGNRLYPNGTLRRLRNDGTARVRATVARRDGGQAKRVRGQYRRGWAARLPLHATDGRSPRAAIRIVNRGKRDRLAPKGRNFQFGADFRLDDDSAGGEDDGDNLIQRGIFNRGRQYKIQVDTAVVSCRIKGSEGSALLQTEELERRKWHRVRCQRRGDQVTLKVWRLTRSGKTLVDSATTESPTGLVTAPRRRPLSVGGRLLDDGRIPPRRSDPFNGIVDRPYLKIG